MLTVAVFVTVFLLQMVSLPIKSEASDAGPFDYTETIYLGYDKPQDRDNLITRLQVIWMNTLNQYQLSNLKVTFVSEKKNVGKLAAEKGGWALNQVIYRLSGSSALSFDIDESLKVFQQSVEDAHLGGVAFNLTGTAGGPLGFEYIETVYLSYDKEEDRDSLFDRLLVIWRNTLDQYQVSDLKVTFISEERSVGQLPADKGGLALNEVTYRLTGNSVIPFEIEVVLQVFQQTVSDAHLDDIAFDAVRPAGTTKTGKGTLRFDYMETVFLAYDKEQDRTELMKRLQVIWRTTLDEYQPEKVEIIFVSEKRGVGRQSSANGGRALNKVTYRLTGSGPVFFNIHEVLPVFQKTVVDSHLGGVAFTLPGSLGSNDEHQSVSVEDSVMLTYRTVSQRNTLLQQVLDIWTRVLAKLWVSGLKISFIKETKTSLAGVMRVSYRITFTTNQSFDEAPYLTAFRIQLRADHLEGIQVPTDHTTNSDETVTTDSEGEATTETIVRVKMQMMTPATSKRIGQHGMWNGLRTSTEESPTDDSTESSLQATKSSTSFPLDFTSPILLTYRTTTERETLLQQVLTYWKNVLMDSAVENLMITFVNEKPMPSSGLRTFQVVYKLSGTSATRIDVAVATTAFLTALRDQPLNGVQIVPLGSTWNNPKINPFAQGKSDSDEVADDSDVSSTAPLSSVTETGNNPETTESTDDQDVTTHKRAMMITATQRIGTVPTIRIGQNGMLRTSTEEPQDEASTQETPATSNRPQSEREIADVGSLDADNTSLDFFNPILLTYTSVAERENLLRQVLAYWKKAFVDSDVKDLKLAFVSEKSATTFGLHTFQVVYRVTGSSSSNIDIPTATTAFFNTLQNKPLTGIRPLPLGSAWQDPKLIQFAQGKSDAVIRGSLLLSYENSAELDRDIAYVRQLYAYVIRVDLDRVKIVVVKNDLVDSNNALVHNVSYTVSVSGELSAWIDPDKLMEEFSTLLQFSSRLYTLTFLKGNKPVALKMTLLDLIQGGQTKAMVHQERLKSYLIFASINLSYTHKKERNEVLQKIRKLWENTAGRDAVSVDLAVTDDLLNDDGSHQVSYAITILSEKEKWDLKILSRKFQQLLMSSRLPTVVLPTSSDRLPDEVPPKGRESRVRSYAFVDMVLLKLASPLDLDAALEALRNSWASILGDDAWSVDISVNAKNPAFDGRKILSYTIMFSSTRDSSWDFQDLKGRFARQILNIRGPGFSVALYDQYNGVITPDYNHGRPEDDDDHGHDHEWDHDEHHHHHHPHDHDEDSDHKRPHSERIEDNAEITVDHDDKVGTDKSMRRPVMNNTNMEGETGMIVTPLNTYLVSEQVRIVFSKDEERSAFMDKVESAWEAAIGNTTEFIQIVLYSDVAIAENSTTHDLRYLVVILSSSANLDLKAVKSSYESLKPKGGLTLSAADIKGLRHDSFLVIQEAMPMEYADTQDRDEFMSSLQQLWSDALHNEAMAVEIMVYDDDLVDMALDSVGVGGVSKQLHQLSYVIVIISDRLMSADFAQQLFQQHLIKTSIRCRAPSAA